MIGTLLLLLLAAPPPGSAPVVRDTVVLLPEVRVERDRPVPTARDRAPTSFATDLRAGAAGRALESLPDLLEDAAGVRVTQYGGLGAFATVSLRGAPPGQVAVYLDGTPLTSAAQGVVNLADLPFSPIERVEVYRGGAPLAFGPALPGGAINLVTLSNPALREARVVRGAFDTWESRASTGVTRGPASLLLHAGWRGSEGDFGYLDDNATPYNPADDAAARRVNNRSDAANALAALRLRVPGGVAVTARELFLRRAQGMPGIGANPAFHARLALERSLTQLEAVRERRGPGPVPALRLLGSVQRDRSRFRDRGGELRPGRSDRDDRFGAATAALDARWATPGRGIGLDVTGSLRGERAAPADAADGRPDPPPSERRALGASAEVWLEAAGGRARVQGALRWDRVVDRRRVLGALGAVAATDVTHAPRSPRLGASVVPVRGLELRANWSDATRVPDFAELFGDFGSVQGNPALLPERGRNWDAGARWEGRPLGQALALEFAHFESRATNLVVWQRSGPSTVRATNLSKAVIDGDELSGALRGPWGLALSGAMTWMSAENLGAAAPWRGKRLPGRPERQGRLRLDWARGGLRAGASLDHLGENFLDPSNRQRAGARTLLGATLGAAAGQHLRVTLEGRNLTDRRAADVAGYPLPGRCLYVSCEYRLGPAGAARP